MPCESTFVIVLPTIALSSARYKIRQIRCQLLKKSLPLPFIFQINIFLNPIPMKRNLLLLLLSFVSAFCVSFSFSLQYNTISYLTALLIYALASVFVVKKNVEPRKFMTETAIIFLFLLLLSLYGIISNESFLSEPFLLFIWLFAFSGFFTAAHAKVNKKFLFAFPAFVCLVVFVAPFFDFRLNTQKADVNFAQDSVFSMSGEVKSIAELTQDKVLIVNMWAIQCGYCKPKTGLVKELAGDYTDRNDVIFINLNTDKVSSDSLKRFLDNNKHYSAFKNFQDKALNFPTKLSLVGVPQTIIIDKKGVARLVHSGYQNGMNDEFKRYFRGIIEELSR